MCAVSAAFPLPVWPQIAGGRRFSAKMCCQAAVSHRGPSRTVSEVGRRQISVLPVPVRPEVVSSLKMVANRPIHCIGVE